MARVASLDRNILVHFILFILGRYRQIRHREEVKFRMSARSMNMTWVRLVASSLCTSQYRACFVIFPPAKHLDYVGLGHETAGPAAFAPQCLANHWTLWGLDNCDDFR